MTVLIIGGHPELQQHVFDALEGRGRTAAVLPATPEDLDAVVAASEAVVYLHADEHERRKPRRASGNRSRSAGGGGWSVVAAAVKKHKLPCVSAAKGARKGKGTITEIRLPEIYGVDAGATRPSALRRAARPRDDDAPLRIRRDPPGGDPLMAEYGAAPSLVDEYIVEALARTSVTVERDGTALVNSVLVDDLAEIVVDALIETETNGDVNKPIVFGDDQAISEIDLALLVARIAFRYNGGREVQITTRPTRYFGYEHERGKGRGDVSVLEDIGWSVDRLTPLDEGVAAVMERRMSR